MFISTSLALSTHATEAVSARCPKWDSNPRLPSQLGKKINALCQLSYCCRYILLIVVALKIHVVLLGCGAVLTGASAARPTTGHDVYMCCVPAESVCSIHDQGVCWTHGDCFSSFKLNRSLKDHAARPWPVPERALADVSLVTAQIAPVAMQAPVQLWKAPTVKRGYPKLSPSL